MRELANGIMTGFLLVIAYRDWRTKKISVWCLCLLTLFAILAQLLWMQERPASVLGGALIGLLFIVISKCTKESIGYGDSWLITILGIYLGSTKILEVMLAAGFGASLFSIWKLLRSRWNKKIAIPFAPFLAAAYIGAVYL